MINDHVVSRCSRAASLQQLNLVREPRERAFVHTSRSELTVQAASGTLASSLCTHASFAELVILHNDYYAKCECEGQIEMSGSG